MIRGISFEVPHKRFPVLYLITKDIEVVHLFWVIVEADAHRGLESYFEKERYSGNEFKEVIKKENCYVISINLQAFLKETDIVEIKNYKDFIESRCELVILIEDNIKVWVYIKDQETLKRIYENAMVNGFRNIKYITCKDNYSFNV